MLQIWKVNARTWIDEKNVIYKKKTQNKVEASDGRTLRAPQLGEKIYLDGKGNGYLFA